MSDASEHLKDAIALLLEDMQTLDRMPFQTIDEAACFAEASIAKHFRFMSDDNRKGMQAHLRIAELKDELAWVYDNSNEQHILNRVAKALPPEDR